MNKEIFVQNIKDYCARKNIKPTVACRESGVGSSFINNIEARGQVPSVAKVQLLAQYLDVTVSELLGEEKPTPGDGDGRRRNIIKIAGRDGSLIERHLTDEQITALKLMLDQFPEVDDL